jgi:hypothetical protein
MRFTLFSLLLISLLLSLAQEPEKTLYYSTGNEATVVGTITLKGTSPKLRIIDMTADPVCQQQNRKALPDWIIT